MQTDIVEAQSVHFARVRARLALEHIKAFGGQNITPPLTMQASCM